MPGLLADSPAAIVRQLLVDLNLGSNPASPSNPNPVWPVAHSSEPTSPDNCITVYNTTGLDGGKDMVVGERAVHNGVQVRVRSTDEAIGAKKARDIYVTLDSIAAVYATATHVGPNNYRIHAIHMVGDVIRMGPAEWPGGGMRQVHTVNALVSVRQV